MSFSDIRNDARSATTGLDVRGYDLTLQQAFPVVTAAAWQGQPTISGDTVVWADLRNGGVADLWAADLTPWNARISIDGGAAWTRSATASLGLFAQSPTGIVTRMTLTNVGEPVACMQRNFAYGPIVRPATCAANWSRV